MEFLAHFKDTSPNSQTVTVDVHFIADGESDAAQYVADFETLNGIQVDSWYEKA
jgi:hypothetical protein